MRKLSLVLVMVAAVVGLLLIVSCMNRSFEPKVGQLYEFTVEELQDFLQPNNDYQPDVVFEIEEPRQTWSNARISFLVERVYKGFIETSFEGFVEKKYLVYWKDASELDGFFACGGKVENSQLPRWDELFDSCIEINPEGKLLDVIYEYEWDPPSVVYLNVGRVVVLTRVELVPEGELLVRGPLVYQQIRIVVTVPVQVFNGREPFFDPRG